MATVQFDDNTARDLTAAAAAAGMTVQEFVRSHLLPEACKQTKTSFSADQFDQELERLLISTGSTLPADFSRADIYADHD